MCMKYSLKQQQTILLCSMVFPDLQIAKQLSGYEFFCKLPPDLAEQAVLEQELTRCCMPAGWYSYLYADGVLTQENSGPISIYWCRAHAVKAGKLSGPAPFLHLSPEMDRMDSEKPVKGNSLFLTTSFQVSRKSSRFNHCVRLADLIMLILVIKTADSLPIQLERPVQWI